jgi:predicted lipid-binding transport protein (Tim44 family)
VRARREPARVGGAALGLRGWMLAVGVVGNFVLGAVITTAAFAVKSLPLTVLRGVMIAVVVYAAVLMLRPTKAR